MCSVVYAYTTRLLCESYASPCVTLMQWVNHGVCVTWNRALFYVAMSRSNVKGCMDGIAKCSIIVQEKTRECHYSFNFTPWQYSITLSFHSNVFEATTPI